MSIAEQVAILSRLNEAGSLRAAAPGWSNSLITDYTQKADALILMARAIDSLTPKQGLGDPNLTGIVANASLIFYDTTLSTPVAWFNKTVGASTGWVTI